MAEIAIELLAERLRTKRAARGVRAVAREIGISAATYSRVENNNMPDLETFRKLCEWVAIDPNEILGVTSATEVSAPRALVHFKNDNVMSKDVATALGEMILKAQKAMIDETY
jgi:transcriptional regulator with XRE-family HTH domain